MNLHDLVIDLDYQKHYTEAQRIAFFNKYQISMGTKFFIPIWALSEFIQSLMYIADKGYREFGHGQTIVNTGLKKATIIKQNAKQKPRIQTFPNNPNRITINKYSSSDGEYRGVLTFDLANKTVAVNGWNIGYIRNVVIPRNLYELIDEWLIDFGFREW